MTFIPSVSGQLVQLTADLQSSSAPIRVEFAIFAAGNDAPGAELWTQTYTGLMPTVLSPPIELPVTSGPVLDAATTYWIVDEGPTGSTTVNTWQDGSPTAARVGRGYDQLSGNGWYTYASPEQPPSLEVDVQPTPEPTTALAAGLFAVASFLRRRDRAG